MKDENDFGRTDRPWGHYVNHARGDGWNLKTLHLGPGARLSLQFHRKRAENWILVEGDARAIHGPDQESLKETALVCGEMFCIPVGMLHTLESQNGGTLIEVMTGDYDENDIERLEDIYGRA